MAQQEAEAKRIAEENARLAQEEARLAAEAAEQEASVKAIPDLPPHEE